MAIDLTEDRVASMAPDEGVLSNARNLIKKGSFQGLSKSEDGTLVFANCKGSAALPYKVSLDFASGDTPTPRCNCPAARKPPCKHALGLALAFVAKGDSFAVAAPPADLLAKRDKLVERRAKAAAADDPNAKPKEVNQAAAAKKTQGQLDGLESLERFVVDVVAAGLGGLNAKGIKGILDQGNRMGDADLKRVRAQLLHLAALINRPRAEDADADEDDTDSDNWVDLPEVPLSDEERHARLATQLTQLWVAIRKGQRMLEGKAEQGESKGEADAQLEALLGRAWKLPELKEAGYWVEKRTLVELAHSQVDDPVLEMVTATGYLLDLGDGAIHAEQTTLPRAALAHEARLRTSRLGTLEVKEAALYPGDVLNRRIRWNEKDPEAARERSRSAEDLARLHALAKPLDGVLKAFREQVKNPLLPLEAVALVAAARYSQVAGPKGPVLVVEDAAGARLPIRDPYDAPISTEANLLHAAGAFGPGSLAVRLWYDPVNRVVWGQGLALIVGNKHLRLSM